MSLEHVRLIDSDRFVRTVDFFSSKFAVRNNLWDWQELEPSSGPNTKFFKFCDALEVKDGVSASESGWGADHAVSAWGSYFKNTYLPNRKWFTRWISSTWC